MKTRLLQILRSSTGPVTFGDLVAALSGAPGPLEKAITDLKAAGYGISVENNAVLLSSAPDIPFPWEFPKRETAIHHLAETGSTMDAARDLARQGCPHLTVVVADTQTGGRGRMDRTWRSDPGGLYMTLVLKPDIPATDGLKLTFLASLTLAGVLRRLCRVEAAVKWPNDILAGGKKLAGLLSEMQAIGNRIEFVNIGIGINVNNTPERYEPNATSIKTLTGAPFSRVTLMREFLDALEAGLQHIDLPSVIQQWKSHAASLGRPVTVVTPGETVTGVAEDVNESGALMVRLADGALKEVCYGDCFHR
ncbi:MAG: biotin--[acetyl-CoA-carboxylase] ligase [Thermodesulfobacteriota bacterium]